MFQIMCGKDRRCSLGRHRKRSWGSGFWPLRLYTWVIESLLQPLLLVRFIVEWYSKDTLLEVHLWFLFLPLVCLASTHPWRTPLSLIWQHRKPEARCQVPTLAVLLCHLKGGRLDRNCLGIYILLLPNLPVSPVPPLSPAPLLLLFSKW